TWARLVAPSGYLLQTHGVVPTLCTADLGDDERSLETGLQRADAASGSSPASVARAALDEPGWSELRRRCPPRHTSPAVDLKLAQRLLADPKLYADALRALAATTRLADNLPAGGPAAPALTGRGRALSS